MFYNIENNTLTPCDKSLWEQTAESAIAVFTTEQWNQELKLRDAFQLNQEQDNIHFCKLEHHATYLFGTFRIPVQKGSTGDITFAVYILEQKMIFIDDSSLVVDTIQCIVERKTRKEYSLERFLYDMLMSLIEGDLLYLAAIEQKIATIEANILKGKTEGFNYKMLEIKKNISRLYRYYSQLTEVGEALCENVLEYFEKEDIRTYGIFTERVSRLQDETQVQREYAMQVQEVYQSEIGIRQNDIMKVLTIVTTIFLPLTLIAGWYGMNFYNMPELTFRYGYPLVALACIGVVLVSLFIFKRKKYM